MIQFSKKINVYSYIISDIYCCDCFFDRIASLINSLKEFTECDEFINILENEFSRKFVILIFGGTIILFCRELIKFIIKIKKKHEKIRRSHCVTDFISDGDDIIEICTVCFIKIIKNNMLLKHFKIKEEVRDETYYLYLWMSA